MASTFVPLGQTPFNENPRAPISIKVPNNIPAAVVRVPICSERCQTKLINYDIGIGQGGVSVCDDRVDLVSEFWLKNEMRWE